MALAGSAIVAVAAANPISGGPAIAQRPAGADPAQAPPPTVVPSNLTPALLEARTDFGDNYKQKCHAEFLETKLRPCTEGSGAARTHVVILGDSHAAQWYPALASAARTGKWKFTSLTKSSCPAATLTIRVVQLNRPYPECDTWRRSALRWITARRPDVVIVTNSDAYRHGDGRAFTDAQRVDGLRRTLSAIPRQTKALVLADTPRLRTDPPTCASEHVRDPLACATPLARAASPASVGWSDRAHPPLTPPSSISERRSARAARARSWRGTCSPTATCTI